MVNLSHFLVEMNFLDLSPLYTFVTDQDINLKLSMHVMLHNVTQNVYKIFVFLIKLTYNNILQIGCEICKIGTKKYMNYSTLFRQAEAYERRLRRGAWNNMPNIELSASSCPSQLSRFIKDKKIKNIGVRMGIAIN